MIEEALSIAVEGRLTAEGAASPSFLHIKARQERHGSYPERFPVSDENVSWSVDYPGYEPTFFVSKVVLENNCRKKKEGWADPETVKETRAMRNIVSYEGEVKFDKNGYPLNPRGRTGLRGRGVLGKWGPNFAVDSLVTRINPETGCLEMIAVRRKDTSEWATPGGMVDYGEKIPKTLRRELEEEAGVSLDFAASEVVYRGYVDDPRNTDNSWMETQVCHLHLDSKQALLLALKADDDAGEARWRVTSEENLQILYASHGDFVRKAVSLWEKQTGNMVRKDGKVEKRI